MKKLNFTYLLLFISYSFFQVGEVYGQKEMSLYHVGNHVYQGSFLNPSFTTEKDNFSIFSLYLNNSVNGLKTKGLFQETSDTTLQVDLDTVLSRMDNDMNLAFPLNIDLLGFKFKYRKNHFSFSTGIRHNLAMNYPKDFLLFFLKGNGQSIGNAMDLGVDFKTMQYLELAFGYAREIKRLKVGVRAKILGGLSTVSTTRSDAFYYTSDTSMGISVGADYLINSSGTSNVQNAFGVSGSILDNDLAITGGNPLEYIFNTKNLGLGFDFGFTYDLTRKIELTGSVLDIGSITWKDDIINYRMTGDYTFNGADLFKFATTDGVTMTTEVDILKDTLLKTFAIKEDNNSFKTNLVPRHYLGANVDLPDSLNLSVIVYGDLYQGYQPNFSIGLSKQFYGWLNFGLNYSIKHSSYENFGASLILNPGPIQLFFMADNLYSLLYPLEATNFNFRFGLNARFRFVRPKLRPKDF